MKTIRRVTFDKPLPLRSAVYKISDAAPTRERCSLIWRGDKDLRYVTERDGDGALCVYQILPSSSEWNPSDGENSGGAAFAAPSEFNPIQSGPAADALRRIRANVSAIKKVSDAWNWRYAR